MLCSAATIFPHPDKLSIIPVLFYIPRLFSSQAVLWTFVEQNDKLLKILWTLRENFNHGKHGHSSRPGRWLTEREFPCRRAATVCVFRGQNL
jgi:hypothetical protein